MEGHDKKLVGVMDGSDKRFVIPVYQRNYDWKKENCKQLFEDLLSVIEKGKQSHFFGSIVSTSEGSSQIIIDGQQRLTTVSLLLIALKRLVEENAIPYEFERLADKIMRTYLTDEYSDDERKMKLKPVKNDMAAFDKLFDDPKDYDYASAVTQNYLFFYEEIQKSKVLADDLLDAIKKLVVIDIALGPDDDPQLIFESLNSTGVGLSEADKIRNYVLMGQPQKVQESLYEKYWNKIEQKTGYKVSEFVRQYLTMKNRKWPSVSSVYKEFKEYAEDNKLCGEELLADILIFAEYYEKIRKAKTGDKDVDNVLMRLARLDFSVANPFLFAMMDKFFRNEISSGDTTMVLSAVESYIFRRLVCGVGTNALNKVFATLHNEVVKAIEYDEQYASAVVYVLEQKQASGRFPSDVEFVEQVKTRDFYNMNSKNKIYYFDRLENGDSKEYLDVEKAMLAEDGLTVEHVMPQTLSESWKRYLGNDAEAIHETWVHRIANLTLTAYNSKYSNRSFSEKKTMTHGFCDSPLPLNKWIAEQDSWGVEQLEARSLLMVDLFLELWPYPKTNFRPKTKTKLEYGLDEDVEFTGMKPTAFTFLGSRYPAKSWKTLAEAVLTQTCELDPAKLRELAEKEEFLEAYLDTGHEGDKDWSNIGNGVYVYLATATMRKIRLIQAVFDELGLDYEELSIEINSTDDAPSFDLAATQTNLEELSYDAIKTIDKLLPE